MAKPAVVANPEEDEVWWTNYAAMPPWLIRADGLTHAQFRILTALFSALGGRKGWWHLSYRRIAELASTDTQTVTLAVQTFVKHGWLEMRGGKNWRQYKLNRPAIQGSLYIDYDEEDEER